MHDQRCPMCRSDVSEWIRRHLFECDQAAELSDQLVGFIFSCLAPERLHSLRESLAGADTPEAREAVARQIFQEAAQAEPRGPSRP